MLLEHLNIKQQAIVHELDRTFQRALQRLRKSFTILKQTKSVSHRPFLQAFYGCTSAASFMFSSAALLLLDTLSALFENGGY